MGDALMKEIINLVKQMVEEDKKELLRYIKGQYTLEEREGMLRDDIQQRIFELIQILFADDKFVMHESFTLVELDMDAIDVQELKETIELDFELETIDFARVMEWQRVKDIIDTVDDILICAESDTPFISGFEVES